MESSQSALMDKVTDFLSEQEWFQSLKSKWEELDQQSRTYIKAAAGVGGVLLFLILILSFIWSVHSLKSDLADKSELLRKIETATGEVHKMRQETTAPPTSSNSEALKPWDTYLESAAALSGIDKANVTVTSVEGKISGPSLSMAKEGLYQVSIKHVSVKQVIHYAYGLETGARPIKVKNLKIDTHSDSTGYMDATLSISAFTLLRSDR